MKSDHRRDYFVMKCKEVSENLEEMVESRTQWYEQQSINAQESIARITKENMTNLTKCKEMLKKKLERFSEEV